MICDKMDSPSVSTRIEDRLGVAGQGEAGTERGMDRGQARQGVAWPGTSEAWIVARSTLRAFRRVDRHQIKPLNSTSMGKWGPGSVCPPATR
jgi:hypothetical protein